MRDGVNIELTLDSSKYIWAEFIDEIDWGENSFLKIAAGKKERGRFVNALPGVVMPFFVRHKELFR
jgi:hypothetical protein